MLDVHDYRVATEDKYGSNVNMEPDSPTDEDKKAKQDEGKIACCFFPSWNK